MQHGIIRKFVAAFSLLMLMSVLILNFFVGLKLKGYFETKSSDKLRSNAMLVDELVRDDIFSHDYKSVQSKVMGVAQRLEVRITVLNGRGQVIGETSRLPEDMDNHSSRLEILRAMQRGYGESSRRSDTLGYAMKYVAVAIEKDGAPRGFVRLAVPLSDIAEQNQLIHRTVLLGGAVAIGFVLVLGSIISRSIITPITEMTEVAQAITRGDFSKTLRIQSSDELGILARSLNTMARELKQTIFDLKRMDKVRTDFVANVSHELKTPLTSIRGFIETLEEGALEDKTNARRFLSIIKRNAGTLSNLTDDLLKLSELESPYAKLDKTAVNLQDLSNEIAAGFSHALKEKNQSIALTFNGRNFTVMADKPRIEQVLANLAGNAIKYSPRGSRIKLSVEQRDVDFRIIVEDNGNGIPEEHLPRICERFYRVDKARSREVGGTGLGLSIVKHTILMHQGDLSIDSTVGKGTRVAFTLPLT